MGQNELRTHQMYKAMFEVENYGRINVAKKKTKQTIASSRAGVAPITIELLKYSPAKKPIGQGNWKWSRIWMSCFATMLSVQW